MEFIFLDAYYYLLRFAVYFFVLVFINISIINFVRRKQNKKFFMNNVVIKNKKYNRDYIDVSKNELARFNVENINVLKDYFYDLFYKFEMAYNSLDFNTMREISTKQVYQNYHTGISLDLKYGKKRIIDSVTRKKVILYELDSTSMKQISSLMIEISYISYVLDKHGYVVSGNKFVPITEKFEVQFRKEFERNPITRCPNCGANLKGNKCDYCKSKIKDVEFKISSIKKIVD